uniref:Large ribosomal subunit protein bL28c n=3 Tax=Ostreococcus sp. 'lucimarinus' TaxID=242159 RepID=A0A7R9XQ07_9CHLO|mmetsp:Transcript_1700/g.6757  ORF Transcript_1700/g.6757 Transcript_1700/m.6757 type:complete len:148 (+) Transcript_1700:393-836(+)
MSGRKCMLTGKKANNGRTVSFSHIRNKTLQQVNLQYKRIYWPEQKRYVRLRISTNALKTLNKLGLEEMAKRAGLDLASLPYIDADPERKQWLAENGSEPVKQNKRAPKGPKPLYIPKWKEAKLAKMDASAAAAEKKRFAEANNMIVA